MIVAEVLGAFLPNHNKQRHSADQPILIPACVTRTGTNIEEIVFVKWEGIIIIDY